MGFVGQQLKKLLAPLRERQMVHCPQAKDNKNYH
jgi:hypothetical protein